MTFPENLELTSSLIEEINTKTLGLPLAEGQKINSSHIRRKTKTPRYFMRDVIHGFVRLFMDYKLETK